MSRTAEEFGNVTLLGNQNVKYKYDYDPDILETFENKHPDNDYVVTFDGYEGTSLCLTGDTLIEVARDESKHPEGIPIKDLVDTEGYVFGVDDSTGSPVVKKYHSVRKTQTLTPVVKITMQAFKVSGNRHYETTYLRCTPDHMILVRTHWHTYEWIKAKDLKPGMHLVYSMRSRDTIRNASAHRLIASAIYGESAIQGMHVHHIDGNHFNNSPDNLELKTGSEHMSDHKKELYGYDKILDVEVLVEEYNNGENIDMLAAKYGCDTSTIKSRLEGLVTFRTQAESLQMKCRAANKQRDIEICELYQRGYTSYEIGEYLDLHSTTILSILRQQGVEIRDSNAFAKWRKENPLPPLNHRIVSVEYDGLEDVYNMEVEDIHNFFANDVIVHNCPRTGQPDFFKLILNYIPREKMVESKSLKLYLFSFRNKGDFHEDCINIIGKDLVKLMDPKYLEVRGIFSPRGGLSIFPFFNYVGDPKYEAFAEQRKLDVMRDASNRTVRYDI